MKIKSYILPFCVVGSLAFATTAQAILIDDFSTDQIVVISGPSPQTVQDTVPGVPFGSGNRDLTVQYTTGPGNALDTATAGALDGQFVVANGVNSNSIITLDWNSPVGVDLTEGGLSDGIFMSLPTPIDNDLFVAFNLNGASNFSTTFPNGSSGNDFFIPFASFTDPTVATMVNSFQLVLRDGAGWDAAIDFIETRPNDRTTVPVPGMLFLMGAGLLGFTVARAKKT